MSAAREAAGLNDFGDDDFDLPMRRFLASVADEAQLSPMGLAGVSMEVVRLLTNRLVHRRDQLEHPEIAEEDVSDPIVILGTPRTGTTELQRVFATDPALQSIPFWQVLSPAPLPGSAGISPDPRIEVAEQMQAAFDQLPDFRAAHPIRADEAEEEIFVQQLTFQTRGTGLMLRIPATCPGSISVHSTSRTFTSGTCCATCNGRTAAGAAGRGC